MKKSPLLLLLFSMVYFSCKKDDPGDSYHITCTIDGVNKSFNAGALSIQSNVTGYQGIAMGGAENSSQTSATFGFEIANYPGNKPITAGIYTDSETDFEVLATYMTDTGNSFEAGSTLYSESVTYGPPIGNHLTIVITSLGNGTMKGTFSGDFHLEADPAGVRKVITNGDFYLPLTTTP